MFPLLRLCLALALTAVSLRAQTDALADFEGTWIGTVTAPNATTTIGFSFTRGGDALITRLHMPAMFLPDAPLGPSQVLAGTLHCRPLDTKLRRAGARLVGTFGLSNLPLALDRAERFPAGETPKDYPPGPSPAWTTTLGGEIWASPTVADDTLYLGTSAGKLHALEAATGRERWAWAGPQPIYGTASTAGDRILFLDARHELVCLRVADGILLWRTPLHDPALAGSLPRNATFNRRTPVPLLHDGVLYVGSSDGSVYAVDPATGGVRWRLDVRTKIYASPAPAGHELLFAGLDGTLLAIDPRERRETRRVKLPGPLSSAPVLAGEHIIVGCRNYTLYGLARRDLSIAWEFSFWFSWVESVPALVAGTLYVGGSDFGRVTALDPATGRAHWSTVVHGLAWGTPLVVGDAVYAGTSAQKDALIPHSGSIAALDRQSGAIRWRTPFPFAEGRERSGILGSLVIAGDLVVAASFDGRLLAYPRSH